MEGQMWSEVGDGRERELEEQRRRMD